MSQHEIIDYHKLEKGGHWDGDEAARWAMANRVLLPPPDKIEDAITEARWLNQSRQANLNYEPSFSLQN